MDTGKVNPSFKKLKKYQGHLAHGCIFHIPLMELIFDIHKTEKIFCHFVRLFIEKHLSKRNNVFIYLDMQDCTE